MIFAILFALMLAATIGDGWSQHRMLTTNGGNGYEVSKIYGRYPTYTRYALVNLPALAFMTAIVWALQPSLGSILPAAAFVAWHIYGTSLNVKNF